MNIFVKLIFRLPSSFVADTGNILSIAYQFNLLTTNFLTTRYILFKNKSPIKFLNGNVIKFSRYPWTVKLYLDVIEYLCINDKKILHFHNNFVIKEKRGGGEICERSRSPNIIFISVSHIFCLTQVTQTPSVSYVIETCFLRINQEQDAIRKSDLSDWATWAVTWRGIFWKKYVAQVSFTSEYPARIFHANELYFPLFSQIFNLGLRT